MPSVSLSKTPLSGSTDGRPIKVAATASPGTTIHTAVSGTTDLDDVLIYATNTGSVTRTLTIQWGGTTDPDDHAVEVQLAPQRGQVPVARGVLRNGLLVRAFADAANEVIITGWVIAQRAD